MCLEGRGARAQPPGGCPLSLGAKSEREREIDASKAAAAAAMDRLSSIKWGVRYKLMILGVVTYVLVVARTGTPTVPTALGVPYDYAPAVASVLGPTISMSVTILKL